jgi:hypothetical protein
LFSSKGANVKLLIAFLIAASCFAQCKLVPNPSGGRMVCGSCPPGFSCDGVGLSSVSTAATRIGMITGTCPATARTGYDIDLCSESDQLCQVTAAGVKTCGLGVSLTPGGSDGSIQTKSGSVLGGSTSFTWIEGSPSAGKNLLVIQAGASQSTDSIISIKNSAGTEVANLQANGTNSQLAVQQYLDYWQSFFLAENVFNFGSGLHVTWTDGGINATKDVGIKRVAAGVVKVSNGSTGFGRLALDNATPANAAEACTAQSIWADASYVYVCTASGAIKRAAIATW